MANKINYGDFVKTDLKEISDWYNKIVHKLKLKFIKEFRAKIKFIKENPHTCEIKYSNFRIAFLKKFPVAIHNEYQPSLNQILIISVFHTSRNPQIWEERI